MITPNRMRICGEGWVKGLDDWEVVELDSVTGHQVGVTDARDGYGAHSDACWHRKVAYDLAAELAERQDRTNELLERVVEMLGRPPVILGPPSGDGDRYRKALEEIRDTKGGEVWTMLDRVLSIAREALP